MWLFRGAQSAVFYYVTCSPCTEYSQLKRRKKEAAKSQRDAKTDVIVTDQPCPVFHPFSTNPYWREEIELGPGPPLRRAQRTGGGGGGGGGSYAGSQHNLISANTGVSSPNVSNNGEAAPTRKASRSPLGDRWNRARYQREDEKLWGIEVKGTSVGLSGRGRSDTGSSCKYYRMGRNPEVNDLHPPIACGPRTREETRWMLQPPPSVKVMEGKACSDEWIEPSRDTTTVWPQQARVRPPYACGDFPSEKKKKKKKKESEHTTSHVQSDPFSSVTWKPSPPRHPSRITEDSALSEISQRPDDSDLNTPLPKRSPLAMIASKQNLPPNADHLHPSSALNSRSNSPAPLPDDEYSPRTRSFQPLTVGSDLRPKATTADSQHRVVTSPGIFLTDTNIKQLCHVTLEHESSESNAVVEAGGGRLQVPHRSRPFRWSLDI